MAVEADNNTCKQETIMPYVEQLPDMRKLRRLTKLVDGFPTTAQQLIYAAQAAGYDNDALTFLRSFHPDERFASSLDFITRCEEMELLIDQERQSPNEFLTSSEC